jgi:hypothetical protein
MKDFLIYTIGTIIVILFFVLLVCISDIRNTKKEGPYKILLDDNKECIIKYRSSGYCFKFPWEFKPNEDFWCQTIRTDTTFWCDGGVDSVGHLELAQITFSFIASFGLWIIIFLTANRKP